MLSPKPKIIYYILAHWFENAIKRTFSLSMKIPLITRVVIRIDKIAKPKQVTP
jgi:hypothetical protein